MLAFFVRISVILLQQSLNGFHKFFGNGMQQCVFCVYVKAYQQVDHVQVLVVDGHQEGRSTQRIYAIDVYVLFL